MLSASAGYGTWVFELAEKYVNLHESRQISIDYWSKAVYVHFFTLGTTASILQSKNVSWCAVVSPDVL